MSTTTTESRLIDRLLDDRNFHIEFNGHLTNHAKHAVVALAGLGASPDRIQAYYENYVRLTPYGFPLEPPKPSKHIITDANWLQLLGRRSSFSGYCAFFNRREWELGMDDVLLRYLPPLLPGWVGAFTHAAIHLGWGLDAGSRWMTIEGLAYLAFAYVSCHPERSFPARDGRGRGLQEERPVDSLLRIAAVWEEDGEALRRWVEAVLADRASSAASAIHPELVRSGLQYRIARLLAEGHPLISETPAWAEEQDLATLWEHLYYAVTLLYLAVPGDFIVLHLITSLHGMEQIACRLPSNQQREVVRCYWMGILGIVFSGASFPKRTKLAALHATYRDAVDPVEHPILARDWEQIIARAFEEEEEHNPKLVYVLRRVWQRTGGLSLYRLAAAQFTATPELPESFEQPPTE